MRVGGTNFNFNELKPSSASGTPEETKEETKVSSVEDRAKTLRAGLVRAGLEGTLGTVNDDNILATAGANAAKPVDTSKPVETTGAAEIAALFDKTQVFTKTASTGGNSETSLGNQYLVLAAKRFDAEPLGVDDFVSSVNSIKYGNEQFLNAV